MAPSKFIMSIYKLIEIFKLITNLVSKIINDFFDIAECQYRLRHELQGISLKQLPLLSWEYWNLYPMT